LVLVAVAGLDPADAADVCGTTPEALRQRLHRAREALSKALERAPSTGTPALGEITSCPTR
jgi:DNA-directed RNA polymerase specialized sigma24 family protein